MLLHSQPLQLAFEGAAACTLLRESGGKFGTLRSIRFCALTQRQELSRLLLALLLAKPGFGCAIAIAFGLLACRPGALAAALLFHAAQLVEGKED
jgi:hypothetical protein